MKLSMEKSKIIDFRKGGVREKLKNGNGRKGRSNS